MGVTVRYWAAAQAATGIPEETIDLAPATLDLLRAHLAERHPGLLPVLAASALLVDGLSSRAGDGRACPDGATVEVLPPFAGG